MRTPRRRRGLLSEPGRGFCQYLALFAQHAVLTPQPGEFLTLGGGQAIAAQTLIECGLFDPFPNGVGRGLELARQLVDAAPGTRQLDNPAPILRSIWLMCAWHWIFSFLFSPPRSTKPGQLQYEEDFLGFSYGYRPGRSPHAAL